MVNMHTDYSELMRSTPIHVMLGLAATRLPPTSSYSRSKAKNDCCEVNHRHLVMLAAALRVDYLAVWNCLGRLRFFAIVALLTLVRVSSLLSCI